MAVQFEVGDIITGLPMNGYIICTNKTIMEVIDTGLPRQFMQVRILEDNRSTRWNREGHTATVSNDFTKFKLVSDPDPIPDVAPKDISAPIKFGGK